MPIYEYEADNLKKGCSTCSEPFEMIQSMTSDPLKACPDCGGKVKKIVSRCRAAVVETPMEHVETEKKITDYEQTGRWSHAAELADTYSEKVNDKGLKSRALENYKKAGYNIDSLEKHTNKNDD